MADDKKIIFSMVGVSKIYPPQKQENKNIYLSFFYGSKIGRAATLQGWRFAYSAGNLCLRRAVRRSIDSVEERVYHR